MKRNVPVIGFLIGAVVPMLGFLIVFLIFRQGQTLGDFVDALIHNHQMFAKILTLSLIANLIPFVYCTNKRIDYTARGILIATMLYAVFIILLRFVW